MRIIKKINNNVALCLDSQGKEVVAFGKGIGFAGAGSDIPLSQISRTFYDLEDMNIGSLQDISSQSISLAIAIIDKASDELQVNFPQSAYLTMADHISFMLKRREDNIYLNMPIIEDIRYLYPDEMRLGSEALRMIEKETGVHLPRNEAGILALHFINDREYVTKKEVNTEEIVEKTVAMIEGITGVSINRDSFSFSRYSTHLEYLIRRCFAEEQLNTKNGEMYVTLKQQYPETQECVEQIAEYLQTAFGMTLTEEEKMYLLIHINRLISRE